MAELEQAPEASSGAPESPRKPTTVTLENIDDGLFRAIQEGDESYVRSRLNGTDRVLSETEALLLLRAHIQAEEAAFEQKVRDGLIDPSEKPKSWDLLEFWTQRNLAENQRTDYEDSYAEVGEGIDEFGGRFEAKEHRYHDRFGGTYDPTGYESADGSYRTSAGDHYDAVSNIIFAKGARKQYKLDASLAGYGADIMRIAMHVADVRKRMLEAEKNGGPAAGLGVILGEAASEIISALPASTDGSSAPAPGTQDIRTLAAEARRIAMEAEAERQAKFDKAVKSLSFRVLASISPGLARCRLPKCEKLGAVELNMAAAMAKKNRDNGRAPGELTDEMFADMLLNKGGKTDEELIRDVTPPGAFQSLSDTFGKISGSAASKVRSIACECNAAFSPQQAPEEPEVVNEQVAKVTKPVAQRSIRFV